MVELMDNIPMYHRFIRRLNSVNKIIVSIGQCPTFSYASSVHNRAFSSDIVVEVASYNVVSEATIEIIGLIGMSI